MRRGWSALALAGALSLGGCKSIEQLVADGQYDAAIESAVSRRRPPKGKQARAWAEALQHTDRFDEARGVLLGDYQHGGDLNSLRALADAELRRGLDGSAAVHYGRIADLDVSRLSGAQDVCALFRRRADALARGGFGKAAARDLSRARAMCADPRDARAQREHAERTERVRAAMQEEVDQRVQGTLCRTESGPEQRCDAPRPVQATVIAAALARAEAAGPAALRAVAREHTLSLSPQQVVRLLVADMTGGLGEAVVGDDEVRRWVGAAGWSQFAPLVGTRPQGEAAYVQLRLAAVLAEMPLGPDARRGPTQRVVWAAQATDTAGKAAWRIFAWLGDLGATELALATAYRPRPRVKAAPVAGVPVEGAPVEAVEPSEIEAADAAGSPARVAAAAVDTAPVDSAAPGHWVTRLAPSEASLRVALRIARLRHLRGNPDLALEIARYVIARAVAAGVQQAVPLAVRHAGWHLSYGRFWQALAVADGAPQVLAPARSAAATAVLLSQGLCGGPCRDDDDAELVTRVLGQAWLDEAQASVHRWATAAATAGAEPARCPTAAERMAAGGPVAALIAARDQADPALPAALARVVESDPILGCAALDATALWQPLAPSPVAESLLELLAHEPKVPTPTVMETLTRLALLAGRPERAESLAIAAAGSAGDPRAVWRRVAAYADAMEDRDLELMALRETLLHTPRLDAAVVREALLVEALADATRSWGVTETPAGRQSVGRLVASRIDAVAPAQRWAARDALLWRVAEQHWWTAAAQDAPWRPLLSDALRGEAPAATHAVALWRLGLAPAPRTVSDFDAAGLRARAIDGELAEIPAATAAADSPVRLQALRLAIARHGGQWQTRWRMAIGLAVYGTQRNRAAAMAVLLSMATPEQRTTLVQLLLALPAALDVAAGQGPQAQPMVVDDESLFRLAAGLSLAPAWYAR